VRRRDSIGVLLALAAASSARGAWAQQTVRQYRIGVLLIGSEQGQKPYVQALVEGLGDRGYVLGRNLTAEFRYVGTEKELTAFADELVALKLDVLVSSELPALFLKTRTAITPIVLVSSVDPVKIGLVKSFARPGTNVTGMANLWLPLVQKQIELLVEIVPGLSRLALLAAPFDPPKDSPYYGHPESWEAAVRQAAAAKKLSLTVHRVANEKEVHAAVIAMRTQRVEGLILTTDTRLLRIPGLLPQVQSAGIASSAGYGGFAENGGLFSYGPVLVEVHRYAARFVDLILKGQKPAEIPVEHPTRFELVINLKTAKALGLKIPSSVLNRADRVIE
jgi:putative ABC transport system substrate-binding protein